MGYEVAVESVVPNDRAGAGAVGNAPDPDVEFTLLDTESAAADDIVERVHELAHRIARELAALGPSGWQRMTAVFALASAAEFADVGFEDEQRTLRARPPESVLALAREQRWLTAQSDRGPWWRMLMRHTAGGTVEIDFDYGDEPFPDEQLFAPEVYRADLVTYPRRVLPTWLAAYLQHDGRQSRSPKQAAEAVRADRAAQVAPVPSERDFPALPAMWARWAVMAAAFVAVGSPWGPRMRPALGWFESTKRSGATLFVLPGKRAVLSGGLWNAPELAAAYASGGPLPRLYAGAPEWVVNPVLNPRVAGGLLSFCYWWDHDRWYRGESPSADKFSVAVPGLWTSGTVVEVISGLFGEPDAARQEAVAALVAAAESGAVTWADLANVFGDNGNADIDGAMCELSLAGLAVSPGHRASK
ncbi:hypothetical protein OH799_33455 [Nocardia sp. NBC_00881]|uniref:hypothetical protein n=1 Tax=Nocardia sp. NBC_00881 TaxID=2975995 RepID=UPI00386CFECD|nr:hypothetical protein OH799_33455 [Nocardia sp. NBC_00881]